MQIWLRRLRGAIGMGLTWGFIWGMVGFVIAWSGMLFPWLGLHRFHDPTDAPLPILLAMPGFVGGVLFSVVLGVAGRGRQLHELSSRRVAVWGSLGGLVLGAVPIIAGLLLSRSRLVSEGLLMTGPLMLLYATSAASSLALARRAEPPQIAPPS